jgi:hypothetical protein
MKRVNQYIGKCIMLVLVMLTLSINSYAQEETKKRGKGIASTTQEFLIESRPPIFHQKNFYTNSGYQLTESIPSFDFELDMPFLNKHNSPIYQSDASPLFLWEYNVSGVIKQFKRGAITGAGSQDALINLGTINKVRIAYYHQFSDKLWMDVGVNATKMSGARFSNQFFGASGSFSYQPQERLTLNTFGSYAFSTFSGLTTYQYGGSVAYDITKKVGLEIGVQRQYNSFNNNWETLPIIKPYYKINKRVALEMDFGGVLHEVGRQLIR